MQGKNEKLWAVRERNLVAWRGGEQLAGRRLIVHLPDAQDGSSARAKVKLLNLPPMRRAGLKARQQRELALRRRDLQLYPLRSWPVFVPRGARPSSAVFPAASFPSDVSERSFRPRASPFWEVCHDQPTNVVRAAAAPLRHNPQLRNYCVRGHPYCRLRYDCRVAVSHFALWDALHSL